MRGGDSLTGVKMENEQGLVINLKWGLRFSHRGNAMSTDHFNQLVTPSLSCNPIPSPQSIPSPG